MSDMANKEREFLEQQLEEARSLMRSWTSIAEQAEAERDKAQRELREAMAMFSRAVVAAGGELRIAQEALLVDAPELLRVDDPITLEVRYLVASRDRQSRPAAD